MTMPAEQPKLPPCIFRNGRCYLRRGDLTWFKDASEAFSNGRPLPVRTVKPDDVLVTATAAARELGIHRRTFGRLIKQARAETDPNEPLTQIRKLLHLRRGLSAREVSRFKELAAQIQPASATAA